MDKTKPAEPKVDRRQLIRMGWRRRILAWLLSMVAVLVRWSGLWKHRTIDTTRVVLLEPFGMGDIISMQPLVNQLLQRNYSVVLCGHAPWRVLYPERPGFFWIDARLPWATHDEKAKYKLGGYLSRPFWKHIQALRVVADGGIGLDTRGDIRNTLVLYLAGCSRVISLSNYAGSDVRMPRAAAMLIPYSATLRRWELNLKFGHAISQGMVRDKVQPPVFPHLPKSDPVKSRVGLVPIAPWAGKLWSESRWQGLRIRLQEQGCELVAFCGPGQSAATAQVVGDLRIQENATIDHWARALTSCEVVVTVDTGPMHLADALGVPTIALFGQGLLPLWSPSGAKSCVISHRDSPDFYPCQPIDRNAALGRKFMDKIRVDEVVEAVLQRMEAR